MRWEAKTVSASNHVGTDLGLLAATHHGYDALRFLKGE